MKRFRYLILALVLVALTAWVATVAARDDQALEYEIKADNGRLIRRVTGDVTSNVAGVPAEPVDSFVWDGDGIAPIRGSLELKVDPVANTGEIEARWTDENGEWTFKQTVFAPPSHPTGLRVGPSADSTELIEGDPITTNVYLHGNTGAGGPVVPTVFNLLATWGPAEITLNGEPFENQLDGPIPLWAAHTMTTVGVRNDEGQVLTVDGGIFNMMKAAEGVTYDDKVVFHLVFHDAPGPEMTDNVPPPLSFFYHITFQDVEIEIKGNN